MTKPMDKVIEEIRAAYKAKYEGLLSPEVIEESAQWLLAFIEPKLTQSFQAGVEAVREKIIGMQTSQQFLTKMLATRQLYKISSPPPLPSYQLTKK